jgi:DnaK suppressor protein
MKNTCSYVAGDESLSIDGVRISNLLAAFSLPVETVIFVRFQISSLWLLNCELRGMAETSSSHNELARFKLILEARVVELERGLGRRDGIAIEQSPDQLDEMQRASECDLAICNIDRGSRQLRDVRAALRRIHDGSFGVCEECEEKIQLKRLIAIPWASLCIHCQQARDYAEPVRLPTNASLGKAA